MVSVKPMSRRFVEDEIVDGNRKTNPVVHQIRLVDVLLKSSMAMSTECGSRFKTFLFLLQNTEVWKAIFLTIGHILKHNMIIPLHVLVSGK